MGRRNSFRRIRNAVLAVIAGGMMMPNAAHALVNPNNFTWIGATSGDQIWNDGSNWSYSDSTAPIDGGPLTGTGLVPGLIGQTYPGEQVSIGETTADRTITTPAAALEIYTNFSLVQSPTSSGVNTLKLGANFGGYGSPWSFFVNNTTGSAANMVIDLNGHTMRAYIGQYEHVTFVTSAAGGEVTDSFGPGIYNSVISSGVTVAPVGWMFSGGNTNTWMPGSRLLLRGGVQMYTYGDQQAYRLEIGESASATQGSMQLVNNWAQSVQQDVVIYAPTNGNPLDLGASTLTVAGNFTDYGTVAGASYTAGTIAFNGSPVTERAVSINRLLTAVDFRVGNSNADKGNIVLAADLTTTGEFHVTNGSALDVADKTLTVGKFTQDATAGATSIELTWTLGPTVGVINVNGDLTLNDIVLNVNQFNIDDWNGTHTLTLFTYTGSLIGTPNIAIGDVNTTTGLFRYSSFVAGGGVVQLLGAEVPEPASVGLLALGGAVLLRRKHRVAAARC